LPAILVVGALIAMAVYVSVDAKFFVYQSEIVGRSHLDAETIYRVAGVHEQNIFWINPLKVAERVVELEGVKAARVRCELPARVMIEVEEREPVVMWRAVTQQQDLWLDEEGVVLPYHGDVDSPATVFVVDQSERHLVVGDYLEPKGIVQSVLQLDAALPGVRVFSYQSDRGLSFVQTTDGGEWPVYVGTSQDLQRKIQVLQVMNGYLKTNGIRPRYVDVRWPDHPVYGRPTGDTTGGGK
jgi:cell division protein FtsQ